MHTSVVVSSTTSACPDVCSDVHVVSRTGSLVSIADSVSGGGTSPLDSTTTVSLLVSAVGLPVSGRCTSDAVIVASDVSPSVFCPVFSGSATPGASEMSSSSYNSAVI